MLQVKRRERNTRLHSLAFVLWTVCGVRCMGALCCGVLEAYAVCSVGLAFGFALALRGVSHYGLRLVRHMQDASFISRDVTGHCG